MSGAQPAAACTSYFKRCTPCRKRFQVPVTTCDGKATSIEGEPKPSSRDSSKNHHTQCHVAPLRAADSLDILGQITDHSSSEDGDRVQLRDPVECVPLSGAELDSRRVRVADYQGKQSRSAVLAPDNGLSSDDDVTADMSMTGGTMYPKVLDGWRLVGRRTSSEPNLSSSSTSDEGGEGDPAAFQVPHDPSLKRSDIVLIEHVLLKNWMPVDTEDIVGTPLDALVCLDTFSGCRYTLSLIHI